MNKLLAANGGASNCNDGGGGTGNCHDNSVYYTWCTAIEPAGGGSGLGGGAHTVQIRLATSDSGNRVFIEAAHSYLDASDIEPENACVPAPPPE